MGPRKPTVRSREKQQGLCKPRAVEEVWDSAVPGWPDQRAPPGVAGWGQLVLSLEAWCRAFMNAQAPGTVGQWLAAPPHRGKFHA